MTAIPRAINAVLDDIPKAFRLHSDENQRDDVPLVPRKAIREAIVNAVMHRSYRQKSAIQIIRYSNRIEIRNPGHSLIPDDRLGEPVSATRNEKIAAVLHETRYAETKGSGIRAMRETMAASNLSPPFFESDRDCDRFVITFLFHHFLSLADAQWLGNFSHLTLSQDEQMALVWTREMGAINNWAYRGINHVDTLTASAHLRRLRDIGFLEQRGKSAQTYYRPTRMMSEGSDIQEFPQGLTPVIEGKSQGLTPVISVDAVDAARIAKIRLLPAELQARINDLGNRSTDASDMRIAIREICQLRPSSAREIAELVGREFDYIRSKYLTPMVLAGELQYSHPTMPSHPNTKYKVSDKPK